MQYLLLIYHSEVEWNKMTPADMGAMHQDYLKFTQEIKDSGHYIGGNPLKPSSTATTVRMRDAKRVVTDGPFAETKELVAGFWIVQGKSRAEVVERFTTRRSMAATRSRSANSSSWRISTRRSRPVSAGAANAPGLSRRFKRTERKHKRNGRGDLENRIAQARRDPSAAHARRGQRRGDRSGRLRRSARAVA